MRLAGPLFKEFSNPEEWINVVKQYGYSAATCPINADANNNLIEEYKKSAKESNIIISEVGAWSNPISPDDKIRNQAIEHCKIQLELAEKLEAKCCVNIAGSRGEQWDGPYAENFSDDTFDLIVKTTQDIIDAVNPKKTFFCLETMPWIFPDSADSYLRLLKAIDRKQFAVHLDPVNMICSPSRYFNNGEFIKECFDKLGKYIKNCHAKDIKLSGKLTVHLDEAVPGDGALDYKTFLRELDKLDPDISLTIEHLHKEEDSIRAANYIRNVANMVAVKIK